MRDTTITRRRAIRTAWIAAAMVLAGTIGAVAAAEIGEDDTGPPPPPGTPARDALAADAFEAGDKAGYTITTGGTTYDPMVLTKFIAGSGFVIRQGTGPLYDDAADYTTGAFAQCVRANPNSPAGAGSSIDLDASVELPDGARIKRVAFYGINNSPSDAPIEVWLHRIGFTVPVGGGDITRTLTTVDSFTVLDDPSDVETVVYGADDLNEVAGSVALDGATEHNFHSVRVRLTNLAGINHRLCGVEIEYQVPVSADVGTVFHPLDGYRAYDSRREMAPVADGRLATGQSRVIPVDDGRNVGTGVIDLPDAIPADAAAVAYTLTVASPTGAGFLWAAPGDVGAVNGSSINWGTGTSGALANSGIVTLDAQRRIKVFAGGSADASTHFVVDITGYFASPELPNMGN